jgi:hypothetical protein
MLDDKKKDQEASIGGVNILNKEIIIFTFNKF